MPSVIAGVLQIEWRRLCYNVVVFIDHIMTFFIDHIFQDQRAVSLAVEAVVEDGIIAGICFCSEEIITSLEIIAVEVVCH